MQLTKDVHGFLKKCHDTHGCQMLSISSTDLSKWFRYLTTILKYKSAMYTTIIPIFRSLEITIKNLKDDDNGIS